MKMEPSIRETQHHRELGVREWNRGLACHGDGYKGRGKHGKERKFGN
jgi:hypothetical protein